MGDTGGVFARTAAGLVELTSQPYDAEEDLQRLLAETPSLLSGDGTKLKWLFVRREVGVTDAPDTADRWSLDHLFVDSEGIPTLVEVKRSSDTRIRREIVGQLLEYAANARHSWPDSIRGYYETTCRERGVDPDENLFQSLEVEIEPTEFWAGVQANLEDGRLRLVFVADVIPDPLRAIVEFLNEQMTKTEVVAVQVRQFIDEDGDQQMLVSTLVGRTRAGEEIKDPRRKHKRWTREDWFDQLRNERPNRVETVEALFSWAESRGLDITFGTGVLNPSAMFSAPGIRNKLLYVYLGGGVDVSFAGLKRQAAFEAPERRRELLDKLNALPGVSIPEEKLDLWPSVPLRALSEDSPREELLRALDWMLRELGVLAPSSDGTA